MDDSFTQMFNSEPFQAPVPRQEIRTVASPHPPAPRATATGAPSVLRWGVDDELNSRIPLTLGWDARNGASPQRRFKIALPETVRPSNLLALADRLVVSGAGPWALLDLSGRLLGQRSSALGSVTLDPGGVRVIGGNDDGTLQLWRLSDAAPDASARPFRLRNHSRSFIATRGSKLLVLSDELDMDVHAAPEEKSMIELIDLAHPDGPYAMKVLRKAAPMQVALHGDRVFIAASNRVFVLGLDLQFLEAWAAEFKPLAISLDEGPNVYLLVHTGGKVSLWKVTPKAERAWETPVSLESGMLLQPPIVGYDHTVYLVNARQITAISPTGQVLWQREGAGGIRGGFVTADDRLVTTEGSQIAAWNRAGERQLIHDCGDALVTPPILSAEGCLYVASGSHLYAVQLPR